MYKGISTSPTDILGGMNVPILGDVPNQSIPMQSNFSSELNLNNYETKIFSNTTILYKNLLDWSKVYIIKLPNQLSAVPALITQNGKICLNMTVAAVHLNLAKNNIVIEDANDFSAAVLFGLNMLLLTQKKDPSLISIAFHAIVDFIHSLITQVYAFDIDFSSVFFNVDVLFFTRLDADGTLIQNKLLMTDFIAFFCPQSIIKLMRVNVKCHESAEFNLVKKIEFSFLTSRYLSVVNLTLPDYSAVLLNCPDKIHI